MCWLPRIDICATLSTTGAEYSGLARHHQGGNIHAVCVYFTVQYVLFIIFVLFVFYFVYSEFRATCIAAFEVNEGAKHLAQKPSVHAELEAHRCATPLFAGAVFLRGNFCHYSM